MAKKGRPSALAHFGERIFDARALALLAILPPLHDAALDQAGEPVAEHAAGYVEVRLKIVEAPHALERRTQDQQRPAVADQLETSRQVAIAHRYRRAANQGCVGHGLPFYLSCKYWT